MKTEMHLLFGVSWWFDCTQEVSRRCHLAKKHADCAWLTFCFAIFLKKLILIFYNSCQDSKTLQHLSSKFMLPYTQRTGVPTPDVEKSFNNNKKRFILSGIRKSFFHITNFKLKQDFPPKLPWLSWRVAVSRIQWIWFCEGDIVSPQLCPWFQPVHMNNKPWQWSWT